MKKNIPEEDKSIFYHLTGIITHANSINGWMYDQHLHSTVAKNKVFKRKLAKIHNELIDMYHNLP